MVLSETLLLSDDVLLCRQLQIRQLAELLVNPYAPTLVIHGTEATGKSLTIDTVLKAIEIPSVIVKSQECITTRHLLERTIACVENSLSEAGEDEADRSRGVRCESISTFVLELQRLMEGKGRFILVFDGIEHQREATPTLLPAVARLSEIIPSLTTILIISASQSNDFHHSSLPHVYFPPYTRADILSIISRNPLSIYDSVSGTIHEEGKSQQADEDVDSAWLWARFTAAVWDSLGQSVARDIISFREVCARLWSPFIQPVMDGHYGAREFSKLLVRNRSLFQNEGILTDKIAIVAPEALNTKLAKPAAHTLPYYPAHLLVSSFLASHNPPRHDITIFSKTSLSKRRKRGGGTALTPHRASKHRKISRKLLGPQPFPLERLFAIFHAILPHDMKGGGADAMCMIASLVGLRLVVRAGAGGDILEGGGKWRCNVGWDFVNDIARGIKFDLESYLAE